MTRIGLYEGDITDQEVDAIVNAANSALVLGSGVAGAIASRGGPEIAEECVAHGPIQVGEAALTGAGALPAAAVIHAAGMPPGGQANEESVRASVRASLELAAREGFRTIALPAIGAGIGGFSMQRCAEVMLEVVQAFCEEESSLEEVHFVLHGEPNYRIFEQVNDAAKIRAQMAKLGR